MLTALYAIGSFFKGIASWFWFTATPKTKLIIIGLILALCLLGYFFWQRHKIDVLQKEVEAEQLNRRLDEVNRITNQLIELEKEGNVLSNNTNNADREHDAVVNRDSSTFDSTNNKSKYCQRYPSDSRCRK